MHADFTFDDLALIGEVRRLGVDAGAMRRGLADSQRWADELRRLRFDDGNDRAANLDRARNGAGKSLADLIEPTGDKNGRPAPRRFRP